MARFGISRVVELLRSDSVRRGFSLGMQTGIVVALVDTIRAVVGPFGGSILELAFAVFLLVVPTAALAGFGLAAYAGAVRRILPDERGRWARLAASALVALPVVAFASWVPTSWVGDHWRSLRGARRTLVVAAFVLIALGVMAASAVLRAVVRRHASGRLGVAALAILGPASALAATACYWADALLYEGDYEDFHYGVSVTFVGATALALAAGRALAQKRRSALFPSFPPRARRAGLVLVAVAPLAVALAPIGAFRRSGALVFEKLLGTVRSITDVDGDGYSSLFGGGDCAAFDPEHSPDQQEIPENGRDEDCTGKDAEWPVAPPPAGKTRPGTHWNVVLLSIDALRADHLGLYGYSRRTSPALDELGERSLVFEHAYSQAPKTGESVPSFMTGTYPSNLPRDYQSVRAKRKWAYKLRSRAPIAVLMKREGYATGAGVGLRILKEMGLNRGFDSFRTDNPDAAAADFIAKAQPPFFYWAHFKQPHAPYEKHAAHDFGSETIDVYDSEVAAADDSVRGVLARLRDRGLADSTVVIVTADHGEEFGEHGGFFHTRKLYRELLHVPLIVKVPGQAARRISEPVELVDLLPTLADLIGFELPPGVQDGQSLLAGPRDRAVGGAYAEDVDVKTRRLMGRAFFDGRYRLVDDLRRGRRELFDDQADPGEQRDLAAGRRDLVRELWETASVRALRRHTSTFEELTPSAGVETWARLLPTLEREEMLELALSRFPRDTSPKGRAVLNRLLGRPELDPAIASRARELVAGE